MNRWLAGLFLLGMLTYNTAPVRADLITDGDFQNDTAGRNAPSSGAWSFTPSTNGSAAGVDQDEAAGGLRPLSGSTNFYAFGASGPSPDTISQIVSTTPGVTYTLTYYVALDSHTGSGSADFYASWNGSVIGGSNLTASSITQGGSYTEFTFSVVGGSGSTSTISFSAYNHPSWWGLDDISLVAPVPEPSSLALCGLGAFGLIVPLGWRRCRPKKAELAAPTSAA
jgi:hypothetical protein